MDTVIAAFTRRGVRLALRIAELFPDSEVYAPERFGVRVIAPSLTEWTAGVWPESRAVIFVGACGIAVRAIAPHMKSKQSDPAVVVVDEAGRYVIPVLSGHIGGANELAVRLSEHLNARAVITTATDLNNLPAVDEWAVRNDCAVENPEAVKTVSGALLDGENVGVAVTSELIPAPWAVTLWLRPRVLVLGAGCNRGVSPEEFERNALDFLTGAGVSELSLRAVASIDMKKDELALREFAAKRGLEFLTYGADELQRVSGDFTGSELVRAYTGTDNVCERACVLAAGAGGVLLRSKTVYSGMTFALARMRSTENDH